MYQHHRAAIESITNKLKTRENILGIIVGGSVAHGFAEETSDIDLMLVLSDEDYEAALKSGEISYYETEATPYEGGYVDGKYTSAAYLEKVAQCGTEPAKFAFKDAFVTFSRITGLDQLVADASRYPVEKKRENIERFHAQLDAGKCACRRYMMQAEKRCWSRDVRLSCQWCPHVMQGGINHETTIPHEKGRTFPRST